MQKEDLGKLIEQIIEEFPKKVLENMKNVTIDVLTRPLPEHLSDNNRKEEKREDKKERRIEIRDNGLLLAIYRGVPRIRWGQGYGNIVPKEITIFQEPVERIAGIKGNVSKVLKSIFYEIVRNFGFDEEKIKELKKEEAKKKSIIR